MLASESAHDLTYAQYLELAASSEGWLEYHDGVVVAMTAPSPEHARFASVSRRAGDLWAFEDLGPGSILQLPSIDLQLPLDVLYRDALGDIAP